MRSRTGQYGCWHWRCAGPAGVIAAAVALPGAGCSGGAASFAGSRAGSSAAVADLGANAEPTVVRVTADWNDINASVDWAVGEAELAVVDSNAAHAATREFVLRSSHDEPGTLVITRSDSAPPPGADEPPTAMTISCSIGRFGNRQTEERFLRALVKRLAALRGVEFRPL